MKTLIRSLAFVSLLLSSTAFAADACSAYKWDVSREVALHATTPTPVTAATDATTSPAIEVGRHYSLTLQPQDKVHYLVAPTKPMLADGAHGGLVKFKVPAAGPHRVAIDAGFWLDVVSDGKPLETLDFSGSRECAGPRKIVVYDMPAGSELTLQIAASTSSTARLTVTPVVATARP